MLDYGFRIYELRFWNYDFGMWRRTAGIDKVENLNRLMSWALLAYYFFDR